MRRKLLVVALVGALVMTSGLTVSAAEVSNIDTEQVQAESTADVVENIVGTDDVVSNITESSDEYTAKAGGTETCIPKDGDEDVTVAFDNLKITIGLPDVVKDSKGVVTDGGTVVYKGKDDTSLSVQALSEEVNGLTITGNRALITIESSDAPKSYSFDYDLPDGERLIKAEDYYNKIALNTEVSQEDIKSEYGSVFIIDKNNEILGVIDSAWAKDADGNSVDTYYKLDGNTLIQVVEFNEDTVFPVVADPTTHPNKYLINYYTKSQVKTIRDQYAAGKSPELAFIEDGIMLGASRIAGACWIVTGYMNSKYKEKNLKIWNMIYNNFDTDKYKKLKIESVLKWNAGHQGYGATDEIIISYVKK